MKGPALSLEEKGMNESYAKKKPNKPFEKRGGFAGHPGRRNRGK